MKDGDRQLPMVRQGLPLSSLCLLKLSVLSGHPSTSFSEKTSAALINTQS